MPISYSDPAFSIRVNPFRAYQTWVMAECNPSPATETCLIRISNIDYNIPKCTRFQCFAFLLDLIFNSKSFHVFFVLYFSRCLSLSFLLVSFSFSSFPRCAFPHFNRSPLFFFLLYNPSSGVFFFTLKIAVGVWLFVIIMYNARRNVEFILIFLVVCFSISIETHMHFFIIVL